jgi:hypothetical protein
MRSKAAAILYDHPSDMEPLLPGGSSGNLSDVALSAELLSKGLLTSSSPKGSLRLGFPASAASHFFPNLYPAGAD